jgi:hypothetical protein
LRHDVGPAIEQIQYSDPANAPLLRWISTLNGGVDAPALPAFETTIRKAGFSIVVS